MDLLLIALAALFASTLTLFSGFGLGTLLMPVMALFVPVEAAVAMTAVVHLANNLAKGAWLGRDADWGVVLRFGLPALLAAFAGAALLQALSGLPALGAWHWGDRAIALQPIKVVMGVLVLAFVALEARETPVLPALSPRHLPLGGLLSGFFGGLSGHQGALRSLFLVKAGLPATGFVATSAVIAIGVDVARLGVYGATWRSAEGFDPATVAVATLAAFAGVALGQRLLRKATVRAVQRVTAALLVVVGLGLVSGLL